MQATRVGSTVQLRVIAAVGGSAANDAALNLPVPLNIGRGFLHSLLRKAGGEMDLWGRFC